MKRIRITATLVITAALALASVGAQAASTDLSSADVVVLVDGADGTVVLRGTINEDARSLAPQRDVEDVLRREAADEVRVIIAREGGLGLIDPIDLLDPRNLPDCDCLLVGDFGPFEDVRGSLPEHFVFHSSWMPDELSLPTDLERIYVAGSPETSSVSLSAWLLGGDAQPND